MRQPQIVILALCAAVTIFAFLGANAYTDQRMRQAFGALAADSAKAVDHLMLSYQQSLDGMAGFLDASSDVRNADWRVYVDTLNIDAAHMGQLGIGYVVAVDETTLAGFLEDARADGITDMAVHPETGRSEKYVVKFIEPIERNGAARGLDISFEEARRTTALLARDTGLTQLTPPLTLVHDDLRRLGFLLLRPRYTLGMPIDTVEERQAALRGWVYSPFAAQETLSAMTSNQDKLFSLVVSDQDVKGAERVFFQSGAALDPTQLGKLKMQKVVPVLGRNWTMTWQSTPAFDASVSRTGGWAILASGGALTMVLFLFFHQTNKQGQIVARLVEKKTRDLSEREDQNRSIVENAVLPILLLDENRTILAANSAAAHLFRFSGDDLLNISLTTLLNEDPTTDPAGRSLAQGVNAHGDLLFLDLQRNDWTTADGQFRQTMLLRDITEEIKSSRALRDNEHRWNLALHGANIGVFDIDLVAGTSVVSDTWRRLMGVGPDDPITDTQAYFLSRIHPDDLPILSKADADCIAGRTPRSTSEFRVQTGQDGWHWMRSDAVVVERDAEGRALRMVGAQTDVNDLRRAKDALNHSENRFRLVLTNAPVGMAVVDKDGQFQDTNASLSAMTGYSIDDLKGVPLAHMFRPEDMEHLFLNIANLESETNETFMGEYQIITKSGEPRWGLIKVSCAFDSFEGAEIYIVQIHDITQQRELDRTKSEFVATVSHELRAPLTSIKGALGLILGNPADGRAAAERRLLEIASINTDRLIYLVNDILDMEKITSGNVVFEAENVDPAEMVANAAQQIKPISDKAKLVIETDTKDAPPLIRVDARRTDQVLANLLSNACKFAPKGSIVRVKVTQEDGFAKFAVTDTGSGVPESFHSRIFQPFSQADSSDTRQQSGTGLGLNISKRIVERMGGTIGFTSAPGGGATTFWFTCPVPPPAKPAPMPILPLPWVEPGQRKRVLHLEDDRDFAEIVKTALGDIIAIENVTTLKDARKHLKNGQFDLVLVDWSLSDGDAADLLDEITRLQPDARVVGLSSNDRHDVSERVDAALIKSRQDMNDIADQIKSQLSMVNP